MNKEKELLKEYLEKVDNIVPSDFNDDQKELAKLMLELICEKEPKQLQNAYQFIVNRIKLGFRFDSAPDIPEKDKIIVLEKDDKRSFTLNENKGRNQLIIGENYDALKALILIEGERERERERERESKLTLATI
ncbi:type III restriction endonuclease subunit M [Mycoplasma sp. NEAQ87857]|uniref:type III restriction endonuclease subunit M n=1 Tax=Mycoplasma sp. NEAQ87857 TaxID=2683967 RepID=UPI001317A40C|nr:type III restriction endonuclease subunit M [Mycoplasma sp. NEAQ87857]QGZ97861.1 type III restriction endonuclease subunit M [Mycoplasma sp. NEAQ87857]